MLPRYTVCWPFRTKVIPDKITHLLFSLNQSSERGIHDQRNVTLRLIPALGDTMLVDLKRKTVRDWLDTLKVGNKPLSNIQSCLRSALNDATKEELIEPNPLAGWTYTR